MYFRSSSNASGFASIILTSSIGRSLGRTVNPKVFSKCFSLVSFAWRMRALSHCDLHENHCYHQNGCTERIDYNNLEMFHTLQPQWVCGQVYVFHLELAEIQYHRTAFLPTGGQNLHATYILGNWKTKIITNFDATYSLILLHTNYLLWHLKTIHLAATYIVIDCPSKYVHGIPHHCCSMK